MVIVTKFLPRSQDEIANGITEKDHVMKSLETSLSHLGMDYVDLYIYHMWDFNTPIESYLETLNDAVKAGKVRQIDGACRQIWGFYDGKYVKLRMEDDFNGSQTDSRKNAAR